MNAVELLPATEATPDNPRWHELRRQGVTASEIPVILGLSTWDSPWALWHRKRGLLDDTPAGESAYWGRHLEDAIADAAIDRVDPHVQMAFARGGLYCHPDRPWQMATPDRLVFHDGELVSLLEIKHPRSLTGWGDNGSDDVPEAYLAQCLWQADVMGVDQVWLAAYAQHELRVYRILVDHHRDDLELMRQAANDFLAADEPPPLDDHPATLLALRRLHPDVEDRDQEIPTDLAARYRDVCRAAREAEAAKRRVEAELRAAMGAARRAVDPGGAVVATRAVYTRRSLDTRRLRADHPDIVAAYATETTVDTIRPSGKDSREQDQ